MATIKEVIQNFCYRINIPAPTAFVGVTSPAESQYLSLFKFIGDNLRNRSFAWPQLKRLYTFTTAIGATRYKLPGDFYRILESSQWDTTNNWPMRGPISDYGMAVRKYAVVSLQTRKAYRLIGPTAHLYSTAPYQQRSAGSFEVDPPGANNTDTLIMGYVSCNWIWPRDWVTLTAYNLGDVRCGDGQVYICTGAGNSGATRPNALINPVPLDGTVTWSVYTEPYLCTPANALLTDNDLVLFDDDLMIEGMRWAYFRAKKQDFQTEREDWENMVKGCVGRFNGPVRINMADEAGDYEEWPNIPNGSWNL